MLKSFRDSLLTTAMAMTPFLLSACDDGSGTNTNQKFEIVVLPLFFFTVSLIASLSKKQRRPDQRAAA